MELLLTLNFCVSILLRASKKFFLLLISITAISSVTPFITLYYISKLIQFLADNINNTSADTAELIKLDTIQAFEACACPMCYCSCTGGTTMFLGRADSREYEVNEMLKAAPPVQ